MRTGLAYTAARILILVIALVLLSLASALNRRLSKATGKVTAKAAEFRERIQEGAAAEDDDADEEQPADLRPQGKTLR